MPRGRPAVHEDRHLVVARAQGEEGPAVCAGRAVEPHPCVEALAVAHVDHHRHGRPGRGAPRASRRRPGWGCRDLRGCRSSCTPRGRRPRRGAPAGARRSQEGRVSRRLGRWGGRVHRGLPRDRGPRRLRDDPRGVARGGCGDLAAPSGSSKAPLASEDPAHVPGARLSRAHVVSADDFSKDDILGLLDASSFYEGDVGPRLAGKILGTLFFEPQHAHPALLRARCTGSAAPSSASPARGCPPSRRGRASRTRSASWSPTATPSSSGTPWRGPHAWPPRPPTSRWSTAATAATSTDETFLDPLHDPEARDAWTGLKVAFFGDLRYGRAVHSLTKALLHFDVDLSFIGPPCCACRGAPHPAQEPRPPRPGARRARRREGARRPLHDAHPEGALPRPAEYEKVKHGYRLDRAAAERFGPDLKILHPSPA